MSLNYRPALKPYSERRTVIIYFHSGAFALRRHRYHIENPFPEHTRELALPLPYRKRARSEERRVGKEC